MLTGIDVGSSEPYSDLLLAISLLTAFGCHSQACRNLAVPLGNLFGLESEQLRSYLSPTQPPLICKKPSQILSNPTPATSRIALPLPDTFNLFISCVQAFCVFAMLEEDIRYPWARVTHRQL